MDFDEHLEMLVANSFRSFDEDERPWGQRILIQLGGSRWLLTQLQSEAEQTRVWLFDAGAWDDVSRTAAVSAPRGDEVEKRLLYPLDDKPVGRSHFCLDSCARIWTRGRGNKLHPRQSEEFDEELNVAQYIIQLLRAVRSSVTTS